MEEHRRPEWLMELDNTKDHIEEYYNEIKLDIDKIRDDLYSAWTREFDFRLEFRRLMDKCGDNVSRSNSESIDRFLEIFKRLDTIEKHLFNESRASEATAQMFRRIAEAEAKYPF